MKPFLKRAWAEIDLDCLHHNFDETVRAAKGATVIPVIKADAYGHGDRFIALELQRRGVRLFAVSSLHEALSLREYGIGSDILILGYTPPENAAELHGYNIIQTIFCEEYAEMLAAEAGKRGIVLRVHIKIDTGMSRLGFFGTSQQIADAALRSCAHREFVPEGIFTHFSSADMEDHESTSFTLKQQNLFYDIVYALYTAGLSFPWVHCSNSAGTIRLENNFCNSVRAGIMLYGLLPDQQMQTNIPLRQVMSLKTAVGMTRTLPENSFVGYGRDFRASRTMKTAVLPVGYADGYIRAFAGGSVLLHGRHAKILGRISMDQTVVDISEIPETRAGDIATLMGTDGEEKITAYELSKNAGTIAYETVCLVGKRVPRIYTRGGAIAAISQTSNKLFS